MDPTTLPPEVQNLLVTEIIQRLPNASFWLVLFGVVAQAWKSGSAHLCDFIKQSLTIADKFVTNGADMRLALTITHLDGDVPKAKPAPTEG